MRRFAVKYPERLIRKPYANKLLTTSWLKWPIKHLPLAGALCGTDTNVDVGDVVVEPGPGFSGTPIDNFMGGNIPTGGIDDDLWTIPEGEYGAYGVDTSKDYMQNDPGDYVRSAVPAPIMGTKQGGMPGGGVGSGLY